MKCVKSILLAMVMVFSCLNAAAQTTDKPIKWRMNVKITSASEGEVIIKAIMNQGWHLYGMNLPKGGPKSTVIDMNASRGVEFTSELSASQAPVNSHDAMFGIDLTWWEGAVTFRRKFKVTNFATSKIDAAITYMGCNNKTCLPPATEKISKRVIKK